MIVRPLHALAAIVVLVLEILIAAFVHDRLVRPHVGDSLAVILLYCAIRAVTRCRIAAATAIALGVACTLELLQWTGLAGLIQAPLARLLLGTQADPYDLLAYGCAAAAILWWEALPPQR